MFEYSTRAYGSQFLGEKNSLKIRYLVAEILSKNCGSFFSGHPVVVIRKDDSYVNIRFAKPNIGNKIFYFATKWTTVRPL